MGLSSRALFSKYIMYARYENGEPYNATVERYYILGLVSVL